MFFFNFAEKFVRFKHEFNLFVRVLAAAKAVAG